ncbi:LamG-like jellyroll fold domain-containing protein [Lignipirellula cremea]|uniref:PA14 domain-containing protein n=1 Tax=Lignipirellula cremea TaxID=2528010 RepID=A0A518E0I8_9BACT|nr:LamG-like jellyroll fold domain-containing protein [Lignipirellula cremea]QDU97571.1 hypothetical protein Pla8534_54210 [Lignipirellula cremea]
MSADFDPYYKWLGIPPKDQPPHHYRLLSIELFEKDHDVIDGAANRLMGYLRGKGHGKEAEHSQRLLNEISKARICLLNADRRQAYDEQLRQQLQAPSAVSPSPPGAAPLSPVVLPPEAPLAPTVLPPEAPLSPIVLPDAPPPVATPPSRFTRPAPRSASSSSAGFSAAPSPSVPAMAEPPLPPGEKGASPPEESADEPAPQTPFYLVVGGVATVLALSLIVAMVLLYGGTPAPEDPPGIAQPAPAAVDTSLARLELQWPEAERRQASLEIQGKTQTPPAAGEVVYWLPPGPHQVVFHRAGYQDVAVELELSREKTTSFQPSWTTAEERLDEPVDTTGGPVDLALGLVAYWPMENNLNDLAGSGYAAPLSPTPANAPTYVEGKVGEAVMLDPGAKLGFADRVKIDGSQAFTLACWVKMDAAPQDQVAWLVAGKSEWKARQGELTFLLDSTQTAASLPAGKSHLPVASLVNRWAHVAIAYDSQQRRITYYLDGARTGAQTLALVDAEPVYVSTLNVGPFTGVLDDLRLYRRAITPAEAAALFAFRELPLPAAPSQPQGTALAEIWHRPASAAADLAGAASLLATTPDVVKTLTSLAVTEPATTDGSLPFVRLRGFVYPTQTAEHTLEIVGSGDCQLFTRSSSGSGLQEIASQINGGVVASSPLALTAGQPYYLEAIYQASTPQARCFLRWRAPGSRREVSIPVAQFSPYPGLVPAALAAAPAVLPGQPIPTPAGGDPFQAMAPAIDLATSTSNGQVELGPVRLPPEETLFARLLGGDHAVDGGQITFTMADIAGQEHAWRIQAQGSKLLPGGEGVIAELHLVKDALQLRWSDNAAMEPASRSLRNCQLELTAPGGSHRLQLRTPDKAEPLVIDPSHPPIKTEFAVADLPDARMIVVEAVPPAAPLSPNQLKPASVSMVGDQTIDLKVGPDKAETLHIAITPVLRRDRIFVSAKASYQVAGMPKPQPFQSRELGQATRAILGQNNLLTNQQAVLEKTRTLQARTALLQVENQLIALQQSVLEIQDLQKLYDLLSEPPADGSTGAVQLRVIYRYISDDGRDNYDLILAE